MLLLHNVIAASETKVENALRAEAVFFCHVEGCQACIGQGMAFVVKAKWAEEHGIFNRNVSEPIPGVATSLRWQLNNVSCWILYFRLHAFSEAARCEHLKALADWVVANVNILPKYFIFIWSQLYCQPQAEILRQPEMTWCHFSTDQHGVHSHSCAVLEVIGTNSSQFCSWHVAVWHGMTSSSILSATILRCSCNDRPFVKVLMPPVGAKVRNPLPFCFFYFVYCLNFLRDRMQL